MAKVIKKFEHPVSGGSTAKHDWDKMFSVESPGAYVIVHGEDFTGDPQNFAVAIKRKAAERHIHVKVSIGKDEPKTIAITKTGAMTDEEAATVDARLEAEKQRLKEKRKVSKTDEASQTTDQSAAA